MSSPTENVDEFVPSYTKCNEISELCPVSATMYMYVPNLGAAIFFQVWFALLLIAQLLLLWRSRLWVFGAWLGIGTCLEMIGYIARIMMWQDVWNDNAMRQHLVTLIVGPTFISGAISVVFKYLILYCGQRHTKLPAKYYPVVFIGTDFICIILQLSGGAVSAAATAGDVNDMELLDIGTNLIIAGVSAQVANMVGCGLIILHYLWKYQKNSKNGDNNAQYDVDKLDPKLRSKFRTFCWALATAYIFILIRCCYRIPEMSNGWRGGLMANETTFLLLDGMVVAIGTTIITVFHPGVWFTPMRRDHKIAHGAEKEAQRKVDEGSSSEGFQSDNPVETERAS